MNIEIIKRKQLNCTPALCSFSWRTHVSIQPIVYKIFKVIFQIFDVHVKSRITNLDDRMLMSPFLNNFISVSLDGGRNFHVETSLIHSHTFGQIKNHPMGA